MLNSNLSSLPCGTERVAIQGLFATTSILAVRNQMKWLKDLHGAAPLVLLTRDVTMPMAVGFSGAVWAEVKAKKYRLRLLRGRGLERLMTVFVDFGELASGRGLAS